MEGLTTLCSVAGTAAPQWRQVKVGVAHTELAVPDVCQVGHIVAESVLLPTEAGTLDVVQTYRAVASRLTCEGEECRPRTGS